MNLIDQSRNQHLKIRLYVFTTLILLFVFGQSRTTLAQQWETSGNNIYNTNSGNVGIGTTAPNFPLEVNTGANPYSPAINIMPSGNVISERATIGFGINPGVTQGWALGQDRLANGTRDMYLWDIANSRDVMYWGNDGNVGIGTTTPYGRLVIARPNAASYRNNLIFATGTNNDWEIGQLHTNGSFQFKRITTQPIIGAIVMTFDTSDNVGIGTQSPEARLHVFGDLKVEGTINSANQDVAEWVSSTQRLSAGTVVTLDLGRTDHVVASVSAYDTRVAGVISAQPGIALGKAGDGKLLVATTGRVRVKVDATRRPVRIGDLLVTSDRAGAAMPSVPIEVGGVQIHRPGTIIGKALEPLAGGVGEILILLSLQ